MLKIISCFLLINDYLKKNREVEMLGEGIRNFAVLLWTVCAINSEAYAQTSQTIGEEQMDTPTEVMAIAKTSAGDDDVFIVEQPKGAPNPLGNPIAANGEKIVESAGFVSETSNPETNTEVNNRNVVVPPSEAQKLGKDFQNTLEEANGMIYDVQSYPEADIPVISDSANPETIYSPNVNP